MNSPKSLKLQVQAIHPNYHQGQVMLTPMKSKSVLMIHVCVCVCVCVKFACILIQHA